MIRLYQFQFSHFCEKARWALDYKGVPYQVRNLLPGLHLKVTRKLAPRSTVPILVDGQTVVQESAAIIDYLDEQYPRAALTPADPEGAAAARAMEAGYAEEIGIPLRLWLFHHLLADQNAALQLMLRGSKARERMLFGRMFPKVREQMRRTMKINDSTARTALERLSAALDRLDECVCRQPFLAGGQFSRADLTACALLSPLCGTEAGDREQSALLPAPIRALRDAHRERPYFNWVTGTYRDYRRKPETVVQ